MTHLVINAVNYLVKEKGMSKRDDRLTMCHVLKEAGCDEVNALRAADIVHFLTAADLHEVVDCSEHACTRIFHTFELLTLSAVDGAQDYLRMLMKMQVIDERLLSYIINCCYMIGEINDMQSLQELTKIVLEASSLDYQIPDISYQQDFWIFDLHHNLIPQ